jgi:transcriptional regulator with XRE-family HTH domain
MKEKLTLGEKIRFFRTQKKLSQSQLELDADLSFGTVSRIECGQINPTKETLVKIAQELKLTTTDLNYLIELKKSDPTKEEIASTVKEVQPLLDQETLPAYVMDNRFRIWAGNKMLLEIFGVSKEDAEKNYGSNVLQLTFTMFNIINKIPKKYLIPVLKEQLAIFKQESDRFSQENYAQELFKSLQENKLFSKLWKSDLPDQSLFRRAKYYLNYKGKTLNIFITRSPIPADERFIFVEYFPQDKETAEIFENLREKFQTK